MVSKSKAKKPDQINKWPSFDNEQIFESDKARQKDLYTYPLGCLLREFPTSNLRGIKPP